ncbi:putative secreted protein (Por secretion system target) [Arcicella aurantiaca]|uniref:Putative secreted protein (Por secretion system target) n=1 Tax=Arcicella aurantiaca TaxID=591202 RepID=A0A316E7G7_9BACT|nr:T9SS type A sorting domain-containing protein [Arcicella aurantiaca]PWK18910.1 putative secreted protein (Por secretion system target) [Arcicella aurantiaca]
MLNSKTFKCLLIIIFLLVNSQIFAQDNQRYLALVLVNIDEKDDNLGVKEIEKAHQLGFNAVNIAVLWDYVKVYRANAPNPWIQVDNQIKKASELGMKIGLRIWIDGWCGDAPQNQWCSNFETNDLMTDGQGRYDYAQSGPGKRSMTSFAATSTMKRMKSFTTETIERYKKYQENGDILYVSLATTGEQELGYPFGNSAEGGLYDYSNPMKEAYRVWLRRRYCNDINILKKAWGENYDNLKSFNEINPKYSFFFQYSFEGQDGRDWYNFRHFMLKRFSTEFIQTVKSVKVNRPFKIINDYGSVFDDLSVRRGTMAFQDLGEGTDGTKINNGLSYNHRFGMDLLRSNLPNKWIMNEAEIKDLIPAQTETAVYNSPSFQQIDQSFTHGAKMVAYFPNVQGKNLMEILENAPKFVEVIKNKWLNNKSPLQISPKTKLTFKLSDFLMEGGCIMGAGRCSVMQSWQDLSAKSGGQPIDVILDEDFIKDNTLACSNSGINAEYEGQLQKADCQGGYGWIVNKSDISKPVKYEILLDGKVMKTSFADSLNPDSQRYSGNANHGFAFKFPLLSEGNHTLKIKIPESSYLIDNAKLNFTCSNAGKQIQVIPITFCTECEELNVYPNPANNRISLGFNLQDFKPVLIEVFDNLGRRVYYSDTYGVAGDNDLEINIQNFVAGAYFINVKIDQKYYQRKFLKF